MVHDDPSVGERVVVRSRLVGETGPSGGPALTDVVGVLEAVDEREVVVRRRDGTLAHVRRVDVVVIKPVPPPPSRRGGAVN